MEIAHIRLHIIFALLEELDLPDDKLADIIDAITELIEAMPEVME